MVRAIGKAVAPELAKLVDLVGVRTDAKGRSPEVDRALRRIRDLARNVVRSHIEAGVVSDVAEQTSAANLREMQRVLGVDRRMLLPNAPLDEWTRQNVDFITTIADDYLDQVAELVTEAADTGMRHEALAARLEERLAVTQSRAALIARDQVLTANAQLAERRMQHVGVTEYIWRATPDSRTRPDHAALDGHRFRFSDPPIVDRRSGRRANPGGDIQCRCQAEPIFADDEP